LLRTPIRESPALGKEERMEINTLNSEPEILDTKGPVTPPAPPPKKIEGENGKDPVELQPGQIEQVARALEQFTSSMGKELKFHVHEESNRIQVDVIDPRSEKIIKKIPPDEILALAVSIERTVGLFLNRIL
jgi:uncharacterized FlaG/YvyC family protein